MVYCYVRRNDKLWTGKIKTINGEDYKYLLRGNKDLIVLSFLTYTQHTQSIIKPSITLCVTEKVKF